jgi:hypothetical protein
VGKWSWLKERDGIERVIGGDDDEDDAGSAQRRERIDALKAANADKKEDLAALGELYGAAKDDKERLEAEKKAVNERLQAFTEMLVERMEAMSLSSFKDAKGRPVILDDKPQPKYVDKRAFLKWVKEAGLEELLTMHYQTMLAEVKRRLDAGLEPPPGVEVKLKTGVQRRKS